MIYDQAFKEKQGYRSPRKIDLEHAKKIVNVDLYPCFYRKTQAQINFNIDLDQTFKG